MKYGIDVSDNNGILDWSAVQRYNQANPDAQIEFAMIASSYGTSGRHDYFTDNVNHAHEIGLECGAYHYSYSINADTPAVEAKNCATAIAESGVLLELPVFYDMEDADRWKIVRGWKPEENDVTAYCRSFIDALGLNCGVYASNSWLNNYIDWKSLNCSVWNAEWGESDSLQGYLWQKSASLIIPGFSLDENGNDRPVDYDVKY